MRIFNYYSQHAGINLSFAAGAMPKLEDLRIVFDAEKIESLGTSGAFDLGIENLPNLVKIRCEVFGDDSSRADAAKAAIQEAANKHPNYPSLSIVGYPSIPSFLSSIPYFLFA